MGEVVFMQSELEPGEAMVCLMLVKQAYAFAGSLTHHFDEDLADGVC